MIVFKKLNKGRLRKPQSLGSHHLNKAETFRSAAVTTAGEPITATSASITSYQSFANKKSTQLQLKQPPILYPFPFYLLACVL